MGLFPQLASSGGLRNFIIVVSNEVSVVHFGAYGINNKLQVNGNTIGNNMVRVLTGDYDE
ncbi:MAG: hypothetical protein IPN36_15300 [Bacteroidetes bacterium]|nr:hypothetical protein [Bacteroidota bacterium]